MSDAKRKRAVNKLLTDHIKRIAEELHTDPLITGPGIDDARMVTKAEALAQLMWKMALGYKEEVEVIDKKTGAVKGVKEVIHFPDKHYIDALYDRLEGRVTTVEPEKTKDKPSVADRVTSEGTNRLNSIAKKLV